MAIYARPDTTSRVLDAIAGARPSRLYVFADAAPEDDPEALERVAETRALLDRIDWPCDLETEFADVHMGLRRRMESGLDWLFSRTGEAVILEDDCLPEPTFFDFCAELLERYRDDERVMAASGNNFQFRSPRDGHSYRFSRYPLIWGWATWARAWQAHDREMTDWPELRASGWLAERFDDRYAVDYWTHLFNQTYSGAIDTWDYRFLLSVWRLGGLSAEPAVNLVSNLGFRRDATHTTPEAAAFADLPTEPLSPPLVHPERVEVEPAGDEFLEEVAFSGNVRRLLERARLGSERRERRAAAR